MGLIQYLSIREFSPIINKASSSVSLSLLTVSITVNIDTHLESKMFLCRPPLPFMYGTVVAQVVEESSSNQRVSGSSPALSDHTEVSLSNTLNPKLLPICRLAPCMAASAIGV